MALSTPLLLAVYWYLCFLGTFTMFKRVSLIFPVFCLCCDEHPQDGRIHYTCCLSHAEAEACYAESATCISSYDWYSSSLKTINYVKQEIQALRYGFCLKHGQNIWVTILKNENATVLPKNKVMASSDNSLFVWSLATKVSTLAS